MSDSKIKEQSTSAEGQTAIEAGWHLSRYNVSAPVPGTDLVAIANLFRGTCAEYSPVELYLLSILEKLDEHHPIIERFARRGIITRMDERAALETMGRGGLMGTKGVTLTICPTMSCNFDCPYCFESHRRGRMSCDVQDDVVDLARRMLAACGRKSLEVVWFGGEPTLAMDIIEKLSGRLIAVAEEAGAEYSAGIITNGYLLTQENIDLLERCRIRVCQVTIDGLGETHDATRHLVGGEGTFHRIIQHLRYGKIPFRVSIRQNVQESNLSEVPKIRACIEKLAEESGNNLDYAPSPVIKNEAAKKRGAQSMLLCETDFSDISVMQTAKRFRAARGIFCGAQSMWSIGVDEEGSLFKCWEAVSYPEYAFGKAHDWDPLRPLETAADPNRLTMYLNTALPTADEECRECVWLPECVGGCPHRRLFYEKRCVAYREQPEKYVLALHTRLKEKKQSTSNCPD